VRALRVLETGPLALVQDLGRPGHAHLGVPASGAADRGALRRGNRLLAGPEGAAGVEVVLGGLVVEALAPLLVAVTGAPVPVALELPGGTARGLAPEAVLALAPGARLRLGTARAGVRAYLCVRGGLEVPRVLGSAATDVLSGLGPPPLAPGQVLAVGAPPAALPGVDALPTTPPGAGPLRVVPGPRDAWFTPAALGALTGASWEVSAASDRVGLRLLGPALERAPAAMGRELASEGVVRGALQVSGDGAPTLFLADAPVTGGYPVIAVVRDADTDRAGQLRPGDRVRLTW
jgi:biotin-dependent carboxylase-like uncharacterized protein